MMNLCWRVFFLVFLLLSYFLRKTRAALSTLDNFAVASTSSTDTFYYWTFNPTLATIPFLCGANYMVGGTSFSSTSQYMERTYSGLGAHFQIKVTYSFYKLDFAGGEKFKITCDTNVQTTAIVGTIGSSQCGGTGNEASVTGNFIIAHTADTLKIRIEPNSAFNNWGILSLTVEIDECSTNCYRCSSSATQCTSCVSGKYLDSTAKTCGTSCPSSTAGNTGTRTCDASCYYQDEYTDANRICQKCNNNCETCSGTATTCTGCKASYYLNSATQTCATTCPSGKKGRNSTRTCDNTCEFTYEFSDPSNGNVCYRCNSNCKTCVTTATTCVTCDLPRFFDYTTNTCTAICPVPYWGRTSTVDCDCQCTNTNEFGNANDLRVCQTCNANCKTCTGTSTSCVTCNNAATEFLDLGKNSACVTECSCPFWGDTSDMKCKASCPLSNYYGDIYDRRCKACNSNCATCVDTAVKCTSCSTGYLNPYTNTCDPGCPEPLAGNYCTHTCDATCLDDYEFVDEVCRLCVKCNSNCKTCVTTATNCVSCPPSQYLNQNTNGEWNCVTICPAPKWARGAGGKCETTCALSTEFGDVTQNRECKTCDLAKCKTCVDKKDFCTSCTDITKTVLDGKCESSCVDGKYLKLVGDVKTCEPCDSTCLRCNAGTNKDCVACRPGTFLLDGSCGSKCPVELYFTNTQTNECVKCENCLTCSGPLANNCLKCNPGDYFLENQCYSTCPKPFYPDKSNINCITHCPSQCLDCDSGGVCFICNPGYYRLTPDNRTCTACTEPNQFQNKTNQTCTYCSDACSKCETSSTCLTCNAGYYLESVTKKCLMKANIGISVVEISNPFTFKITFEKEWKELFDMFKNRSTSQFSIWIENNKTLNYSFTISKAFDNKSNNSYEIRMAYLNFSNASNINFQFGYPVEERFSRFAMNQSLHTLPLREIVNCSELYYYDYNTSKCVITTFIDNTLDLTRKANRLTMSFSQPFDELFAILPNITIIGIENLNDTEFDFNVTRDLERKTLFHIQLNYSRIVLSRPLITLILNVPNSLRAPREKAIVNYNFSLNLMDYYELSPEEDQTVDNIWSITEYIYNYYFPSMLFVYAIITPGNSFAIRGTITFYCMHYMKLIAASYPPYASALFDSEFLPFNFIPNVNLLPKDGKCKLPRGSLLIYGMECYILESLLAFLILFGLVLVISPLFAGLRRLAKHSMSVFLISRIFSWNLLIVFTFGFSLKYLTHGFITLKFNDFESTEGKINFAVSLLLLIFYLITLLSVRKKVSDYRDIFFDELESYDYSATIQSPNQVVPTRDQSLIGSPSKSPFEDNESNVISNMGDGPSGPYPALSAGTIASRRASRMPTTFKNISKAMTRLSRRISESFKKPVGENKRISMRFNMAQRNLVEDPLENNASYVTVKTMKTVQNQILNINSLSEEEYELYLFSNKYLVLSRDFRMTFFFPSYFLLFDQVRFLVFSTLLATEDSSLYKLFTVNFLNSIMVLYIILARPFKSRWHFAQHLLSDILLLSFGALCFALYWFDAQDENNPIMRLRAGLGMVAVFYIWVCLSGLFLLIELIRVLRLAVPQISAANSDTERYSSLRTDKIGKTFQETKTGKNFDVTLGNEDPANQNGNSNFSKSVVIQDEDASKGLLTPKMESKPLAMNNIDQSLESPKKKPEVNPFEE